MNVVSLKSLYNHLLAQVSAVLSRFGMEYTSPMPTFISIEPASMCQLHCPQCPCGTGALSRSTGNNLLSMETFQKILDDCHGWVHTFQFYFQGEPLLNPHLVEMIQMAHRAHIYTICSTNAQTLTAIVAEQLVRAGLDRMVVSIDGLSEDSYGAYRQGGSLNKALHGLIYMREAKERLGSSIHLELQCLRLKCNEHEWEMLQRSYRKMGADSLTLKTAQFYSYQYGNPMMPSEQEYCRYQKMQDGRYVPKNRLQSMINRPCRRLLMGCVITVNGDVLPCCFDKAADFSMGNVCQTPLASIWHGKAFRAFRRRVYNDRMKIAMCQNCTEC